MVEQDAAPARTVRTRASGTPWVCRPPQLSGAAQIKGLDAGRTNAGQSPREPVGFDPARIGRPICPRPGSTVPGSENAAHDKAQPAQAWLGGAPQGARVSARTEMRSGAAARRHRKPRRCASRRSVPLDQ